MRNITDNESPGPEMLVIHVDNHYIYTEKQANVSVYQKKPVSSIPYGKSQIYCCQLHPKDPGLIAVGGNNLNQLVLLDRKEGFVSWVPCATHGSGAFYSRSRYLSTFLNVLFMVTMNNLTVV